MAAYSIDFQGFIDSRMIEKQNRYVPPTVLKLIPCYIKCPALPGVRDICWNYPFEVAYPAPSLYVIWPLDYIVKMIGVDHVAGSDLMASPPPNN